MSGTAKQMEKDLVRLGDRIRKMKHNDPMRHILQRKYRALHATWMTTKGT